ncbi:PAS domain S-box protein [Oscillatoria sp. FACHB-1406]|uniref:PAS domain S-box protein n=1 Tax=Oscillatoria sp. FACHB-1406 TaxID=2692846 RepID=UPI001689E1AA|nr:PAS domain S-box protein [Oscillatoria sp. FACHB-1406]MBD2576580.1 PAS domain S-box protein [Oscillatoria sp. FACHB-1406]
MRALVEFTPAAIPQGSTSRHALFDREMRYLAASQGWKEDYRLGECELIGRSYYELHPEISERWKPIHQHCLNGAIECCEEESLLRADGTRDWLKWEVRPWYDLNGAIGGIIMLTEVITQRKQAEIALEQLNKTLETQVEERTAELKKSLQELAAIKLTLDLSIIVAITDRKGTITYANDKFCEISQYSRAELIGQNHRLLNSGYHPPQFFQQMWKTIASGQIWQGEICNRAKDGSLYWVDTTIVPSLDESGKPEQYVAVCKDISDRKQAEADNQKLAALVDNSNDFIALGSLEGKALYVNPAGRALMGLEAIEDLSSIKILDFMFPEDREHFLQQQMPKIQQQGFDRGEFRFRNFTSGEAIEIDYNSFIIKHPDTGEMLALGTICRDIRERKLSQLQLQQRTQELEETLHELRHTQMQMLHSEKMSSLGQIEVSKQYGQLPKVECYPGQLNQVWMNILVNAIDALEERDRRRTYPEIQQHPSRIQICTEAHRAGWVSIRIKDNGSGIPPAILERIFDPFFTTKDVGKGTGLGMSISYQIIVEKHKGKIRCLSEPGAGTEFAIEIPIRQVDVKE